MKRLLPIEHSMDSNLDQSTVASFGDEWSRFDQSDMPHKEAQRHFDAYFSVFPWNAINQSSEGFDMGCGTGRWARFVAPRCGLLNCIDPSSALAVARQSLVLQNNIRFHQASVSNNCITPGSQDFGYSLGVLHHVPDTAAAIRSCVALLKPGAPLLLYLYYAFDNRPRWFYLLWRLSNIVRLLISSFPPNLKCLFTDILAALVYLPLARFAALCVSLKIKVDLFPLSAYKHCSFNTMRTDSRDRFGTPLERRFTRTQITLMLTDAGLVDLKFSNNSPYWVVVGFKALN